MQACLFMVQEIGSAKGQATLSDRAKGVCYPFVVHPATAKQNDSLVEMACDPPIPDSEAAAGRTKAKQSIAALVAGCQVARADQG
jgi:hypothetical protein